MRIQQFVVHPQIYIEAMRAKFKGAYPRPDWTGTTTKFSAFTEVLSASEEPTIVFCNFRAEMDMVRDHALGLSRKVWSIRGGMGSEAIGLAVKEAKALQSQNEDLIKKGLKGGSAPLIIVQIVAGGAGINLQFCTRILFLSQHWNPAVVHQACGRAVRIGQSKSVSIHFFSVDDSVSSNIDRRMLELHLGKVSVSRAICHSFFQGSSW
jgi:SNF2 family DNA or RNA helicase